MSDRVWKYKRKLEIDMTDWSQIWKYNKAKVSLPGGCAIVTRPVYLHLFALKKMGAKMTYQNQKICFTVEWTNKNNVTIQFGNISTKKFELFKDLLKSENDEPNCISISIFG